jgi:phenylacetate-CoA ligase
MNWREPLINLAFRVTNRDVLRELSALSSLERASAEQVRSDRERRLERLLRHAWRHTDYYREVLESCGAVRSGRVRLDRFEDIPFLTKDILRTQFDRLRARGLPYDRRAKKVTSGGTTGEPISFLMDNVHWAANIATRIHHFGMLGKKLGDREMKVWGNEGDFLKGTRGVQARVENVIYNRKYEAAWHLSEQRAREIVDSINEWRPKFLWCTRDGIDGVAKFINARKLPVHSPSAIVLGASTIYPFVTKTVEQAFHSPVLSAYGSREVGGVACECLQQEGHHIATNMAMIETIDSDGKPVMERDAELVVTALNNFATPFIRYRIGDRGTLTRRSCSCGRPFPLLESISGRLIEVLLNSKGEQVDPLHFMMLVRQSWDAGRLRQFQIVQEKDLSVTVNLVPEKGVETSSIGLDRTELTRKIRGVMGEDCDVRYEIVPEIPLAASGKFPYVMRRH